jgi:cell volume regulation protein A
VGFGLRQVAGGIVAGVLVGVAGSWVADRARLGGGGLFAVLASGLAGTAYGLATQVGGSGLLAVYLVGMVLAHRLPRHLHSLRAVHEGFAFAAQMMLFLLLGLQVFPSDLPAVAGRGLVVALALVLVARPLAVLAVVPWFRFERGAVRFVSWAGLRGGVPIVLATFPLTAHYPDAELVFDVVFFVVLVSVALQGSTIGLVARRLGLRAEARPAQSVVTALDGVDADVIELTLDASAAVVGRSLAEVPMPVSARVAMVLRAGTGVVPRGDTVLEAGDVLVVVAGAGHEAVAHLHAWAAGSSA